MTDLIDQLAGVERNAPLAALRDRRADAKLNAQKSYEALFEPKSTGGVSLEERHAVAVFVAGLHRDAAALAFYRGGLGDSDGVAAAIDEEIERGAASGPYGHYPEGPLSAEDKAGPSFRVSPSNREKLGARLAAAFEHAHLLVFHPRDASPAALEALRDAGWAPTDIVTLSQLVAFLTFQIRVVAGLRTLANAPA
ncbi:MAG TPA: CMD domain protein [Roseiarcus sp.]|jgi:CMD domain protein